MRPAYRHHQSLLCVHFLMTVEYEAEFSVKFDGMVDMGNGKTELKVCCCKVGTL